MRLWTDFNGNLTPSHYPLCRKTEGEGTDIFRHARVVVKIMDAPETVIICSSPRAGTGARGWVKNDLADRVTRAGYDVKTSESLEEISQLVGQAIHQSKLRCVVSIGGDGTLGLLVRNLPECTPFLPVPLGTENLLAKNFHYSWEPAEVTDAIVRNQTFKMDAGLAGEQIFLIMATSGFDAEVTRLMSLMRTGHIRRWSYARPIWSAMRNYAYPLIYVRGKGFPEGGLAAPWLMTFNLPRYAMGLSLVSNCSASDGLLDTCLLMKPGLIAGFGYLANVLLSRHQKMASVKIVRSDSMLWESEVPVPYQLDGDFAGYLPVSISVLPNRVTLVAK